jgi:hypothetical protein
MGRKLTEALARNRQIQAELERLLRAVSQAIPAR